MGHFSRECRAQGVQNSNNYQKYKSKEAGKDGSDSKAMVVVDGSIDWDKQTKEGNTDPRSLESFGMLARIKLESDVVQKAHKHAVKSLEKQIKCHQTNQLAYEEKIRVLSYELEEKYNILEYRQKLIDQATQDKHDLMTKLDNELANQAKWNNSGELGIDDSVFIIFHITSDDLEGQPIYNRFASVDNMKAVPSPLTGNYMPPSNIPDIDESQMVYGKKATDSSEIKTNDDSISHSHDSVLFDFSDSVSAPASASSDIIVIDCARQEDFPSVCPSSIKTEVKSSKTLCNKFSYLHLTKDCDFHEQTFAKRNDEGKGKLGKRPTGKPVNPNRPNPVSAGQQNTVSAGSPNLVYAGQPNPVSAGNGILGLRPLNIQSTSTYFHSFTHNNQQIIFPITHNSLYSLYKTGGLNGKTVVKPSAGWPWTKYMMEKAKDKGIVDSGCSRSMSDNKDKLEDFEHFDGGKVTFGGSTCKISAKGTIKTKTLNFKNVLYVKELQAVR
nr:ribonuclease H-like domain-containing protein [Tanacetum cinerariifolium]